MSSSLFRMGRAIAVRPWRAIGAWLGVIVAMAVLAVGLGGSLSADLEIGGTEAQNGLDTLSERFPQLAGGSGQIVFRTTDGSSIDAHQEKISQVAAEVADIDGVAAAPDPFGDLAPGTRNGENTAIMASVQMDGNIGEFPPSALDELTALAANTTGDGLEVLVGGQIFTLTEIPFSIAEVIGLLVAFLVLGALFRAVIPASIPILSALVGVGVAMAAVLSVASFITIPSVTPTLALMLGLAVGIDYALFILSRHRDQLAEGMDVVESTGRAIATSGSAVIFAGMTVVIALVGLFITRIGFLTVMGLASAFTVALAVVVALTLLPAIMGLLGEKLRPAATRRLMEAARAAGEDPVAAVRREAQRLDEENSRAGFYARWVDLVTRIPLVTTLAVIAVALAMIIPAKDLTLALPDMGTDPEGSNTRRTYDVISEEFGEGYTSPLLVTADIINTTDPLGVMEALRSDVEKLRGVKEVQLATPNETADMGVVVIIPEGGQADPATAELVHELRDARGQWEENLGISDVTVTGQTAAGIDITERLSAALLPFLLFVVGLSLVLLTIVFRSIWVPLKATLGFLLSIGASFGVVTMVFNYGWLNDALGIGQTGPVISFLPILVTGVLFGLAMDYEVFLVSRMREDYVHTSDAHGSIRSGFVHSAPVVVAAALIMISVFGSFVPSMGFMVQPIALALAVGVAVDAFLVRMTLVPAVLALLRDRAWHLPRWLEQRLPSIDAEGEGLVHVLEHRDWTQAHGIAALRLDGAVIPRLDATGEIGPLTVSAAPGTLLVLRHDDPIVRESTLAALAGRLAPSQGILAISDRVAADQLGALQACVHRIPEGADVTAGLAAIPPRAIAGRVIVLPSIDSLAQAGPETTSLLESLLRQGATVVVGSPGRAASAAENIIEHHLEDPSRMMTVDLPRSPGLPAGTGAQSLGATA